MGNHTFHTLVLAGSMLASACTFDRPADVPSVELTLVSGDGQTGTAGSLLAAPFEVKVADANDNPIDNFTIDFAIVAGGGTLSEPSVRTDAQGFARTTLTLGTIAGPNTVEARDEEGDAAIDFNASGIPGIAARIVTTSGDGQSATVGSPLASPLTATVEDENGNPVAGVTVDFAVTGGGGSVSAATETSDATGQVATALTTGVTAGVNTVEVSATGLASASFTATGVAGAPAQIVLASGDGQVGTAGSPLAAPLTVTVKDAHQNGVPGVSVDFVATVGGGSISTASATTDASGNASTSLTTGPLVGTNKVEARVAAIDGSPIVFTAAGVVGAAAHVVVTSGNNQIGTLGDPLAAALVATVEDANHNVVSGATVSFVVTSGGGTVSTASALTNALGRAQTGLTLGTASGTHTVEARVTGASSAVFLATAASFAARQDLANVPGGGDLTVADMNGDGEPDIVAISGSFTVGVYLNTTAAMATTSSFSGGDFLVGGNSETAGARSIAIGDINGDGKPDIAIANVGCAACPQPGAISVLLNTTSVAATVPTFAARVVFPTGINTQTIAVGDVNGDGKPDIAFANTSSSVVSVLLNTTATNASTPSFSAQADFVTNPTPTVTGVFHFISLADLNADGKPDLAVVSPATNTVSVLLNTTAPMATTASFAAKVDFTTGSGNQFVTIADANGDGKPDLVIANACCSVEILANTTPPLALTPSFASKVTLATGPVDSVALGDVNGDGRIDLAVANQNAAVASILLSTVMSPGATPSFTAPVAFATTASGVAVALSDINADGKLDVAVSNSSANASILLGN